MSRPPATSARPAAPCSRGLRRVLGSRAGFTLTEALATVLIVGLVTTILAGGISLAVRHYTQSMLESEAQMLYSSLQKVLDTELRYTTAITTEAGQVTGFASKHYKARVDAEGAGGSYVATEKLCTVIEGAGDVLISQPSISGQLAMTSGFDAATAVYSPLLGSGAYTKGLSASIPSLTYDAPSDSFVVNLVISQGAGSSAQEVLNQTFTVKAMNYSS